MSVSLRTVVDALAAPAGFLAGGVVLLLVIRAAALRFEARQKRLGRWDERGPLWESTPPDSGAKGRTMEWLLEAKGLRRAVRRRRQD